MLEQQRRRRRRRCLRRRCQAQPARLPPAQPSVSQPPAALRCQLLPVPAHLLARSRQQPALQSCCALLRQLPAWQVPPQRQRVQHSLGLHLWAAACAGQRWVPGWQGPPQGWHAALLAAQTAGGWPFWRCRWRVPPGLPERCARQQCTAHLQSSAPPQRPQSRQPPAWVPPQPWPAPAGPVLCSSARPAWNPAGTQRPARQLPPCQMLPPPLAVHPAPSLPAPAPQ